jgi:hypothetical protein
MFGLCGWGAWGMIYLGMRDSILIFEREFAAYRGLATRAAAQLTFGQLRTPIDHEVNSIAVMMKHIAGNLRSRWTDVLTTDGEKPWRRRDEEFIDTFESYDALMECWGLGWAALETQLGILTNADLATTVRIRGEPHSLLAALVRSLAHTAYHCGQIVESARVLTSASGGTWTVLTIPRGGSAAFNAGKGMI